MNNFTKTEIAMDINIQKTTAMRELSAIELEAVNGGIRKLIGDINIGNNNNNGSQNGGGSKGCCCK